MRADGMPRNYWDEVYCVACGLKIEDVTRAGQFYCSVGCETADSWHDWDEDDHDPQADRRAWDKDEAAALRQKGGE